LGGWIHYEEGEEQIRWDFEGKENHSYSRMLSRAELAYARKQELFMIKRNIRYELDSGI